MDFVIVECSEKVERKTDNASDKPIGDMHQPALEWVRFTCRTTSKSGVGP